MRKEYVFILLSVTIVLFVVIGNDYTVRKQTEVYLDCRKEIDSLKMELNGCNPKKKNDDLTMDSTRYGGTIVTGKDGLLYNITSVTVPGEIIKLTGAPIKSKIE